MEGQPAPLEESLGVHLAAHALFALGVGYRAARLAAAGPATVGERCEGPPRFWPPSPMEWS